MQTISVGKIIVDKANDFVNENSGLDTPPEHSYI